MDREFILEKIATNIRVERVRKKYSQEKLAEMAGITTKYMNLIENAKTNPSITIVINICDSLEIDLNKIYLNTEV